MAPPPQTNGANHSLDISPLGMTGERFVEAANSSAKEIDQYFSNITDRPVLPSVSPGYLKKLLPSSAPDHGESWDDIQQDIEKNIMPGITHWQHPKYMAFFPATTSYPSMLGEMWSAALSSPAFNWICSPVVTELETIVMDWFAQIFALPECFHSKGEGGGVIQLSASDAIATMMVAARERFVRRQIARESITDADEVEDRSCAIRASLVALGTDQSHSSTKKGALVVGTRFRSVATHHAHAYALQASDLRAKIAELKSRGLNPYYLTITLGTTNTCAVDDFAGIAAVAADNPDIWIHVDAAYAGAALVLPEYQHLSAQMDFADSFNTNLHKWLLVNFDASMLYVRKRRDLTDALSITPSYLRNEYSDQGLVTDYRDWQIPLGRRFRALKIWFVVRTFGVEGLRTHVRHGIGLGGVFAGLVRERSDLFTLTAPPRFALTVFSVNPSGKRQLREHELNGVADGPDPRPDQDRQIAIAPPLQDAELEEANALTKEVYEIIDQGKEFFVTSSVVGGVYAIRVVSANMLAEERYVREVFDLLVKTTENVLAKRKIQKRQYFITV